MVFDPNLLMDVETASCVLAFVARWKKWVSR